MTILRVLAGPRAQQHLREHGLRAADVRMVPGAAGGAKALALNGLDRLLFGQWLGGATVHLLGASIGSWRMAAACQADPDAALAQLAEDYVTQRYEHLPGRRPDPGQVSESFARQIERRLGQRPSPALTHPQRRLHVFTSRGRGPLRREGRWRTPLGYAAAFAANAAHRRALGSCFERVVFSDPRDPLPLPLDDLRSRRLPLTEANLLSAIRASCTIPFWMQSVRDIPGAPPGPYWDGGLTDYHLHLPYARLPEGLVLYPHFHDRVVPGWLDKPWPRRHRATAWLDNLVLLAPHPDWVARLPGGRLPDRADFQRYAGDDDTRERRWRQVVAESQRLAEAFDRLVRDGAPVHAERLR